MNKYGYVLAFMMVAVAAVAADQFQAMPMANDPYASPRQGLG